MEIHIIDHQAIEKILGILSARVLREEPKNSMIPRQSICMGFPPGNNIGAGFTDPLLALGRVEKNWGLFGRPLFVKFLISKHVL